MPRYLILDGTKVVNVVTAEADFAQAQGWIEAPTDAAPGDAYSGGVLTKAVPPIVVPQTVTRRQAKQALFLAGKLSSVQPAIDAITDATQRGLLQIEWDESLQFERQRPTLIALATALGLDSAALDALFIQAAALQ